GVLAATQVRALAPGAHVCFYGLYAGLNAAALAALGAHTVLGSESETALVELARALAEGREPVRTSIWAPQPGQRPPAPGAPDRAGLPTLDRYARAVVEGAERLAGYVEASRGCLHHCRHCPIPPVYKGRFFVTPVEAVMDDVGGQVAAGARHITFGDADFLDRPTHARAVAQALAARFPGTTFDVTAKIEHLIGHPELLPLLARAGCVFVVSAVESLSDTVLAHLQKGHTRADVVQALALVRAAGLALRPSLVSFTPWTTLDDYLDVLDWVDAEGLWEHVDPVQWTIRLLVPPGSLLEHDPVMTPHVGRLVPSAFAYEWRHPDARMDRLHAQVTQAVKQGVREERAARVIFEHVRAHAEAWARPEERRSRPRKKAPPRQRRPVPRLTEPWFC